MEKYSAYADSTTGKVPFIPNNPRVQSSSLKGTALFGLRIYKLFRYPIGILSYVFTVILTQLWVIFSFLIPARLLPRLSTFINKFFARLILLFGFHYYRLPRTYKCVSANVTGSGIQISTQTTTSRLSANMGLRRAISTTGSSKAQPMDLSVFFENERSRLKGSRGKVFNSSETDYFVVVSQFKTPVDVLLGICTYSADFIVVQDPSTDESKYEIITPISAWVLMFSPKRHQMKPIKTSSAVKARLAKSKNGVRLFALPEGAPTNGTLLLKFDMNAFLSRIAVPGKAAKIMASTFNYVWSSNAREHPIFNKKTMFTDMSSLSSFAEAFCTIMVPSYIKEASYSSSQSDTNLTKQEEEQSTLCYEEIIIKKYEKQLMAAMVASSAVTFGTVSRKEHSEFCKLLHTKPPTLKKK